MELNNLLEIFIITYNRIDALKETMKQLLAENSPVKDLKITILDNKSPDGTAEYIENLQKSYNNIHLIKNKYNVGVSGNIIKPFEMCSSKYLWILCDDDFYYWDSWSEVTDAITNNKDIILTASFNFEKNYNKLSNTIFQCSFPPAVIYKTDLITDTVMRNMYETTFTLFPYVLPAINYINHGGTNIAVASKDIVKNGSRVRNNYEDKAYTRGSNLSEINSRTGNMLWSVGWCSILHDMQDKNLRMETIKLGLQRVRNININDLCKILINRISAGNIEYIRDLADVISVLSKKERLKIITQLKSRLGFSFKKLFYSKKHNTKKYRFLGIPILSKKVDDCSKTVSLLGGILFKKKKIYSQDFDIKEISIMGIKILKQKKYKNLILKKIINSPQITTYRGIYCVNRPYVDKLIPKYNNQNKKIAKDVIVSMTSFPERLSDIKYAIFSIFQQSILPEKFILWLTNEELPNGEKDIPESVLQFKKWGLEIRFTDNIRSYNKIIPTLKEFPDKILVSADDDIFYPDNWLENLYNSHLENPKNIYANRIHEIIIENNNIASYNNWTKCIINYNQSNKNFPTTVAGIIYPPHSLYKDTTDANIFMNLCPNQDDIWIWAMANLNNTPLVSSKNPLNNYLIYVNPERELGLNGQKTLASQNVINNENDNAMQAIISHYNMLGDLNGND